MSLPEEDRYLKTREDLIDYMTVCLGGRVAEQLVFGAVTTGAANDLQKVAEITHAMVNHYAMGTAGVRPARLDRHRDRLRALAPASATRSSASSSGRPSGPPARSSPSTAPSSTSSPRRCSSRRCSTARDLDRILGDVPQLDRARPRRRSLRIAAADPGPTGLARPRPS